MYLQAFLKPLSSPELSIELHPRVLGDAAAAAKKDCGGGGEDRLYDALISCSVKDQVWKLFTRLFNTQRKLPTIHIWRLQNLRDFYLLPQGCNSIDI